MIETKACIRWAAIRRSDEGYNWIDTASIGCNKEQAADRATILDREIPTWAAANPCICIQPVEIRIVADGEVAA